MLVVGGMFSLTGAVTGVVAVTAVVEFLRFLERGVAIGGTTLTLPQGSQEIGLGVVMALILIFRPTGLSRGREIAILARTRIAATPDGAPALPGQAESATR